MLDFVGALVIGATIAMVLVGVASTAFTRLGSRLGLAAIAGAWVGVIATLAASSHLTTASFGALFAVPILALVILGAAVPAVRAAILGIPTQLIIGLKYACVTSRSPPGAPPPILSRFARASAIACGTAFASRSSFESKCA